MTQFTCAHCGQPVPGGNLCADCQALRAYHPNVFFGQGVGPSAGIDKTVIFAVSSVVALAILVGISWPYLRSGPKQSKMVIRKPLPPVESNVQQPSRSEVVYTPPRTFNLPMGPPPAYVPAYIPPPIQTPATTYKPQFRPLAAPADGMAAFGSQTAAANQSLPGFISAYCAQRSQQIGMSVRSTGVAMLAGGIGAQLSFEEGGSYRQGTAEFMSGTWTWIQRP